VATKTETSSNAVTTSICNSPKVNTCNFYKECLENKFHCGTNGYPIQYGDKNCNKFLNALNQFSDPGKKWVTDTMLCLQNALVSTYNNDKATCSEIENTAFDSHARCYVDSGICNVPLDWKTIFQVVGIQDLGGMKIVQGIQ
ncbi:5888_t:CDS:2, partial [Gigaspora rosea]